MIVSINPEAHKDKFVNLLDLTTKELNAYAQKKREIRPGKDFEPIVKDIMCDLAKGTIFENSIELVSGQKFPDIIAKNYYGVEVKTTTKNYWRTTGNSVLENTRIDNIERIFMMFAKLAKPVEFKCRPYEDVLSDVVVTHSPRYQVDMNLTKGETIFDKIKIPYDVLRKKENPIKPIMDYYKSHLKQGSEFWWIEQENNDKSSSFIIKIWNTLSQEEKNYLKNQGMAYFPELFGNGNDKFGRFAVWLVKNETIVCPNTRDLYTAGGKGNFSAKGKSYREIPRILLNLFENLPEIIDIIAKTSPLELSEYWGVKTNEKNKITDWIDLITNYANKLHGINHLNVRQMILDLYNSRKF